MFVIKDEIKKNRIELSLAVDCDGDVRVLANGIGVLYFCNEDLNVRRLHISWGDEETLRALGVKIINYGDFRVIEFKQGDSWLTQKAAT